MMAAILSLVLAVGIASPVYGADSRFSDVPTSHWAYSYVEAMAKQEIVAGVGDGKFDPDRTISADQFAVMIDKAFYRNELTAADFNVSKWWMPYIQVAQKAGILNGTEVGSTYAERNGTETWDAAKVKEPLSRYDMAMVMYNVLQNNHVKLPDSTQIAQARRQIGDYASISSAYRAAVETLYTMGCLSGTDEKGSFCGSSPMTRAQACVVMMRLLENTQEIASKPPVVPGGISLNDIPAYKGQAYAVINRNEPFFTDLDYSLASFEQYSKLDVLGRCGVATASVGIDIMPTEERGAIGDVRPTGWHTVKYDCVSGKYLYNRCHLLGYQLTGENANPMNLITGTRYLNMEGMLPFENMVADYVEETHNHVLYRATPMFDGDNLLAAGVLMEARSFEDNGAGICFNVFCYNVQPGIVIDYATGDSRLAEEVTPESVDARFILNTGNKKFHLPACSSVDRMLDKNRQDYTGSRNTLIAMGYTPCSVCNP